MQDLTAYQLKSLVKTLTTLHAQEASDGSRILDLSDEEDLRKAVFKLTGVKTRERGVRIIAVTFP